MIKRPEKLELRLETYSSQPNVAPVVTKQYLPLKDFVETDGYVQMGPVKLTNESCVGTVGNISFNVLFQLSGRGNHFIPDWIEEEFDFIPDFQSHYGSVVKAVCDNHQYQVNLPMVYSSYPIKALVGIWRWVLISAMSFNNTDLQVEIVGAHFSELWTATSYVYYKGEEYHLDDPVSLDTTIGNDGAVNGNQRLFSASMSTLLGLDLNINCGAAVDKFALLDKEGSTYIHTTVLGECQVVDNNSGETYVSGGTSLLEIKDTY